MARDGWSCKEAAGVVGIQTSKATELIWPHFRTYRLILRANPTKTLNALTAVMCQYRNEQCPDLVLARSWNLTSELDMERLSVALDRPRGTVKNTFIQCLCKLARLMLADPLRTLIDLSEATLDEMTEVEWEQRYRVQTGRADHNSLYPLPRLRYEPDPKAAPVRASPRESAGAVTPL